MRFDSLGLVMDYEVDQHGIWFGGKRKENIRDAALALAMKEKK